MKNVVIKNFAHIFLSFICSKKKKRVPLHHCKILHTDYENNMSNKIKHAGIVESIDGGGMKVRIMQTSACSGCKISAHCSASDTKEKLVDIYDKASIGQHVAGDSVVVVATYKTALQAVVIGFVLPFIVLVAMLVIVLQISGNEVLAALLSLGVLIPYFFVVFLMREKLKQKFSFTLE